MGYTLIRKHVKFIACILLFNILASILYPLSAYALTSGPSQPETQSFQPAGVSDMVDQFSGDFKYNIPLMDVDGYPLNLSYQSGSGMDDEASWVGLGWNLNVGSISRQMRGVPDDFSGDSVKTEHYTKDKVTVGGRITAKVEVFGKYKDKVGVLDSTKFSGSLTFGIFSDNYTGIGAELGVNAGISFGFINSGAFTSSMGIGVLSNTSSGVDVTPNISMSISEFIVRKVSLNAGLTSSFGYNTRSGLKGLTLGQSFSGYNASAKLLSYNTEPISPKIQIPYHSNYESFSFDIGGMAYGVFLGGGGTGYQNRRGIVKINNINEEYGFLYSERGKNKRSAVHDLIREKENPVINELPNLALPVHTPDIFTYTSQMGSGQFRLYRGGTGAFSDNEVKDVSEVFTTGLDIGVGKIAHFGITHFDQYTVNTTRKWTKDNNYLKNGDFQDSPTEKLSQEHVYFRKAGEKNIGDTTITRKLQGISPVAIDIFGKVANSSFLTKTNNITNTTVPVTTPIIKQQRDVRQTSISYLTAGEAKVAGLDTTINTYQFIDSTAFSPSQLKGEIPTPILRDTGFRKPHHISEITVTAENSQRMIYGIPVYNKVQEEYSFAVGKAKEYTKLQGNLIVLNEIKGKLQYKKGIDHYYHKETQPGYASSYLLTGILSPDYVDVTGNGISDDDLGTGMKFKYSKLDSFSKWRTPYATRKDNTTSQLHRTAALNKGLLADPDDDKASIVYGEKEIYYVRSIESKTQIAYFITADRLDALGVKDWMGDRNTLVKQKYLKEIRLYSKYDDSKPIKVVKFDYTYELCKGVPNSIGYMNKVIDTVGINNGKLTLKKVWFEYGTSIKGKEHPYTFIYENNTVRYTTMATDRWGTYKDSLNNLGMLTNEEYPYTLQDTAIADANASLYQLTSIGLPTGGVIDVDYEADRYAYVQNKKAAIMVPVIDMVSTQGEEYLKMATAIHIKIDQEPPLGQNSTQRLLWFKHAFLDGSDYIYTKMSVNIAPDDAALTDGLKWDFVSTYCKVIGVYVAPDLTAAVYVELIDIPNGFKENAMRLSAWQKLKNDYPRYAYPGFLNRVGDGNKGVKAAVKAVVSAAKNLTELKENFYAKAYRKSLVHRVQPGKSFARISKTITGKIGGGIRVKKIQIKDNWKDFTGDDDARTGIYGQSYEYTTTTNVTEPNGTTKIKTISSGVASYEPAVGSDENPLKQPVPYVQRIKGAINNYLELEEPFGESFFPAPSVGYSKITVRDLDANGDYDPRPKTGSIVNEFYTAKDFPVNVQVMPIKKHNPKLANTYSLVKTNSIEELVLSQGYAIELNDMHGKPKANRIYNQTGAEISSVVYQYAVEKEDGDPLKLNNKVDVINQKGMLEKDVYIGRDIELFTDFREQESINSGTAINIGMDLISAFFLPIPIPHWPINGNNEYKLFRSACAVKVIQNYGILKKVIKTDDGSSISVENVAYDGLTGEALVTKTQNEFNNYYYTTNIPAHWIYPKMGGAYQNMGIVFNTITLNSTNEVTESYSNMMNEGDEITDLTSGTRYWVLAVKRNAPGGPVNVFSDKKLIINKDGAVMSTMPANTSYKIVRSAFRNQLTSSAGSIVSLNNPLEDNPLHFAAAGDVASALKVINASATTYSDNWGTIQNCITQPTILENTSSCFTFATGSTDPLYSVMGMRIQKHPDSAYVYRTSKFWGGVDCGQVSGGTTYKSKAADTVSVSKSQRNAIVANLVNLGTCTRSDLENVVNGQSCWPLNRAGIWLGIEPPSNLDEWIGFEKCVDFPSSKTYYFGFAADNGIKVYVDNISTPAWELSGADIANYEYWTVKPLTVSAGKHKIRVEFMNKSQSSGTSNANNKGAAALEIYNKTYEQLIGNCNSSANSGILFSTKDLRGQSVQSFRQLSNDTFTYRYTYENGTKYDECSAPETPTNPYFNGSAGNWKVFENKVYQAGRAYNNIFDPASRGVDISNSGYLKSFKPYWNFSVFQFWEPNPDVTASWVTANTVTLYDKYGQELENRDALNRYSSALFDFSGELPSAVASNAMNRELFVSGFEDHTIPTQQGCTPREFVIDGGTNIKTQAVSAYAHTGLYSVKLPITGTTISTIMHKMEHKKGGTYLGRTSKDEYKNLPVYGLYPNGFEPYPKREYIFNVWVWDKQTKTETSNKNINIKLYKAEHGGELTQVALTCKAVVEGWKLLEGTIALTNTTEGNLNIKMSANIDKVYIDDIRIHPKGALLKSYTYDDRTMKLMAELDENCFATFYEYDDSGALVRVKKETERGIITIKESRSSYRKKI